MRVKLERLDPKWLNSERDWGAALDCLCPIHRDHRITITFEQACGGNDTSSPDIRAHYRTGTSFATLSLHPTVELPGCGRMTLTRGEFEVLEH